MGGAIVGGVVVEVDVTERLASQETLRELLATVDLGAFMARDLDGTIRHWSQGCERLYGWTAAEAVGCISHALLQTQFPVPLAEIEETLQRDGEWEGDLRHRTRDGRELIATARKTLRHAAPRRTIVLEQLTDVTTQRRTEAALVQATVELERLVEERTRELRESESRLAQAAKMEALGRLAGGVAHDFNNVLQSVQGGVDLALKTFARDAAQARSYLAVAMRAAERGASVTGRLLTFARRGDLSAEPIAPMPMIHGMAELLRHTLGASVTVAVDVAQDVPPLLADRAQL